MFRLAPFVAASLLASTAVVAQVTPPPVTTTDPAVPAPVPSPTALPPTPTPTPTPEPAPAATPTTPTDAATAAATPTRGAAANPTPEATPGATPTPVEPPIDDVTLPTPSPSPAPVPAPADLPAEVTTTVADDAGRGEGGGGWLLWAGIGLVVVAALIVARVVLPRRRRPSDTGATTVDAPAAAPPIAADEPVPVPVPAAAIPAIDFRPARIGLNMVSVTATGEVVVGNEASGAMHDVRVRASLLAAAAGHEAGVAALHRDPVARLAAPPFALASGETRAVRVVVAASRTAIEPLSVAGRPMMVPLVAVTVDWRDEAGEHRRTQAFAVGVERVDSPKLAPVWLDQDGRTFDAVAARPHGSVLG